MDNNYDKPTNEELPSEKLLEAAKPLIKYLAENHHPHITCIVDATHVEMFEGQMTVKTTEYLRD